MAKHWPISSAFNITLFKIVFEYYFKLVIEVS